MIRLTSGRFCANTTQPPGLSSKALPICCLGRPLILVALRYKLKCLKLHRLDALLRVISAQICSVTRYTSAASANRILSGALSRADPRHFSEILPLVSLHVVGLATFSVSVGSRASKTPATDAGSKSNLLVGHHAEGVGVVYAGGRVTFEWGSFLMGFQLSRRRRDCKQVLKQTFRECRLEDPESPPPKLPETLRDTLSPVRPVQAKAGRPTGGCGRGTPSPATQNSGFWLVVSNPRVHSSWLHIEDDSHPPKKPLNPQLLNLMVEQRV